MLSWLSLLFVLSVLFVVFCCPGCSGCLYYSYYSCYSWSFVVRCPGCFYSMRQPPCVSFGEASWPFARNEQAPLKLWGRAASGARTRDLRLGKPLLYQLSYCRETQEPSPRSLVLVEPITRLELVTHALRMRCSTN